MGQRNMFFTHQIPDLESERAFCHLYSDDQIMSHDTFGFTDHVHALPSNLGHSVNLGLHQFSGHHDPSPYYANQYNNFQNCHHVPYRDICGASLPNSYPPVFHPTCSRIFPVPQNIGSIDHLSMNNTRAQFSVDNCHGRDNLFVDNIGGSHIRKNAQVVPGNYRHGHGSASSSLSSSYRLENSGLPQWDVTAFTPSEYQANGNLQTVEGSHRNLRNSTGAFNHQPESAEAYPCDCLLQQNNMGQSFLPANNGWIAQPDNVGDMGSSSWNSSHAINYMHRRCFSSGAVQVANIGVQEYAESSSSTSPTFLSHPASMPNFHHHVAPGHNMQINTYGHHSQVPGPYYYPGINLHRSNVDPSLNGLILNSRFPIFPSSTGMIFRPPVQLHQRALAFSHGGLQILSSGDAAMLDLIRVYGVDNVVDQHEDMRLDIEEMSYEELLVLEEQIGDVNTGLTEESILKNLKTTVYDPRRRTSLQDSYSESETCAVCQVKYEEEERIGTLDCGHYYHADCVKQWLLLKNLCPICKKPALLTNTRDG